MRVLPGVRSNFGRLNPSLEVLLHDRHRKGIEDGKVDLRKREGVRIEAGGRERRQFQSKQVDDVRVTVVLEDRMFRPSMVYV